MSRKGELAKFIKDEQFKVTYSDMVKYQETHSFVKVKKSGQQVLIQVDGDKAFVDAESFVRNYIANLRQRVNDSITALEEVENSACGAQQVDAYWNSSREEALQIALDAFRDVIDRRARDDQKQILIDDFVAQLKERL